MQRDSHVMHSMQSMYENAMNATALPRRVLEFDPVDALWEDAMIELVEIRAEIDDIDIFECYER